MFGTLSNWVNENVPTMPAMPNVTIPSMNMPSMPGFLSKNKKDEGSEGAEGAEAAPAVDSQSEATVAVEEVEARPPSVQAAGEDVEARPASGQTEANASEEGAEKTNADAETAGYKTLESAKEMTKNMGSKCFSTRNSPFISEDNFRIKSGF